MTKFCILQIRLVKEEMTHLVNQQTNARFWDACGPHYLPKQRNEPKASNNGPSWIKSRPEFFSELTVSFSYPSLFKGEEGL